MKLESVIANERHQSQRMTYGITLCKMSQRKRLIVMEGKDWMGMQRDCSLHVFLGVKILKRENILRMMMVMDADTCEYTTSIKMYFNMADLYGI